MMLSGIETLLLLLYFVPTVVAAARGHTSVGGIFVINLFLGWTFIGWVCALAWSGSGFISKPAPAQKYGRVERIMRESLSPRLKG